MSARLQPDTHEPEREAGGRGEHEHAGHELDPEELAERRGGLRERHGDDERARALQGGRERAPRRATLSHREGHRALVAVLARGRWRQLGAGGGASSSNPNVVAAITVPLSSRNSA